MPRHNHITRDIKPRGVCPGCDEHYAKSRERVEEMLMGQNEPSDPEDAKMKE